MIIQKWYKKHDPDYVLEACKLSADNASDIVHWCDGLQVEEIDPTNVNNTYVGINVPGYARRERASEGDYIVKDGELGFIVCKPGLFEMFFERVS